MSYFYFGESVSRRLNGGIHGRQRAARLGSFFLTNESPGPEGNRKRTVVSTRSSSSSSLILRFRCGTNGRHRHRRVAAAAAAPVVGCGHRCFSSSIRSGSSQPTYLSMPNLAADFLVAATPAAVNLLDEFFYPPSKRPRNPSREPSRIHNIPFLFLATVQFFCRFDHAFAGPRRRQFDAFPPRCTIRSNSISPFFFMRRSTQH